METTEHLCARCARHTTTCCQRTEIYITPGDVERIAAHIGRRDFYEFRPAGDPVYLHHEDDPIWPRLTFKEEDGTRRLVKWRDNGDCTFLGPQGCTLTPETRPLICRIYPFDYNEQEIKPTLAKGCPLELLPPGQPLLQALDMQQEHADAWRRQLYAELPLELTADDYRADV